MPESELNDNQQTAVINAARLLSKKPLSEMELYNKLIKKGIAEEDAAFAVRHMSELSYINDEEYKDSVIENCIRKNYGAMKIKEELYKRGIRGETLKDALNGLPDQTDAAFEFIKLKLKGGALSRDGKRKMFDALIRRGFSFEEASCAIFRYSGSEDI